MPRKHVDVKSDYRILAIVRTPDQKEVRVVEEEEMKRTDELVGYARFLYGVMMVAHLLRSAVDKKILENKVYVQGMRRSLGRVEIIMVDELDKERLRNSH